MNLFYSLILFTVKIKRHIHKLFHRDMYNNPERHIPKDEPYCYTFSLDDDHKYIRCPFWEKIKFLPRQADGYCKLINKADYEFKHVGLLWDQCKECGINIDYDEMVKNIKENEFFFDEKYCERIQKYMDANFTYEEAKQLAKNADVFIQSGQCLNADEIILTTLKSFKLPTNQEEIDEIITKLNNVGNKINNL